MPVQWNILAGAPDPGNAFAAGLEHGREQARQLRTDNALAAFASNPADSAAANALLAVSPALGFKAGEYQRDMQKRDAMGRLFDPEAAPAQDAAPGVLVDPSRLPRRTDGLALNHDALRTLYQLDPESALTVQKHVFDANQAHFREMQARGSQMASVAFHLKQLPEEQRGPELQAMAPQLVELGFTPEQIAEADLSDTGLDRYIVTGQAIGALLRDDRAERRFQHDVSDDEADNARADRNTDSMIAHRGAQEGIARRGQDIASSDRRRGQDQADTRARRGQDMTDKRVRESAAFRGKGGGGKAVPTATNPNTGQRLEYRNGKWGPAK